MTKKKASPGAKAKEKGGGMKKVTRTKTLFSAHREGEADLLLMKEYKLLCFPNLRTA